ncbi:hypothetical protein IFM89_020684 [Coptis chinensis]|uniref:P-type ATPase A domain-containing protein n=1 Tax=Coptis chinensis TaxID=261450 RepID=A0A835I065_9MAGN|nr:hypothetical protein IFM89_020684 [Coptis chinensis]
MGPMLEISKWDSGNTFKLSMIHRSLVGISSEVKEPLKETLLRVLVICLSVSIEFSLMGVVWFKIQSDEIVSPSIGRDLAVSWALWLYASLVIFLISLDLPFEGVPNMNTLVGLGALSSFAVSSIAKLIPKLGWKTFFEEPVMLIAFVLLGRNLEQRAKLKASSDMTGLLSILPSKARLIIVNGGPEGSESIVEVQATASLLETELLLYRINGIVKAGRSTVDESSFTGEPLPVTKLLGAEVSAGSINLNGTLTVEVRRPGGETVMGDIIHYDGG